MCWESGWCWSIFSRTVKLIFSQMYKLEFFFVGFFLCLKKENILIRQSYLLCLQACLLLPLPPNLIISLQAVHFPQSGDWQTWFQKGKIKWTDCFSAELHKGSSRVEDNYETHLTHSTAMSLDSALFVVLLNLIGEEGIEDLADQLGGGGLGWSLTVLLYFCWVTNGLSPGRSPVRMKVCV